VATVHTDFPGIEVRRIIEDICVAESKPHSYVTPFQRFGKSGAKLLLLYFADRPIGLPYILKIAKTDTAQTEFSAIECLYETVRDCHLRCYRLFEKDGWGGLPYEHHGADGHGEAAIEPISFRQILWRDAYSLRPEPMPAGFPDEIQPGQLEACIKEALSKLEGAHSRTEIVDVKPVEQYKWYLRDHRSKDRLTRILGTKSKCEELSFLNAEITNPLWLIERLPDLVSVNRGYVHGDLHPDNIVLDKAMRPHLIDFAWGRADQDILVDYALFECSIRFWHFPKWNLEDQLEVDKCLLDWDGYNKIDGLAFSSDASKARYHRLAVMIKALREAARRAYGATPARHYLFLQFILLYGLLTFDDYDSYVTTRALGMIASRVITGDWEKELRRS
jgi:hypothetical protein